MGLSYAQRFRIAFQEMKAIYPDLGTNLVKPLINYFRDTRNNYAHAVQSTSDDFTRYIYATQWIAEFLTLMIFRACGLSDEKIKQSICRNLDPDHTKTKRFFDCFQSNSMPTT